MLAVQVVDLKDVLIDYYIAANDTVGNLKKTDIYHVYVGGCTTNLHHQLMVMDEHSNSIQWVFKN